MRLLRLDFSDQLAVDLLRAPIGGPVRHASSIIDERLARFEEVERQHEIDVRANEQIGA